MWLMGGGVVILDEISETTWTFGKVRTYRNHIRSEDVLSPAIQNSLNPLLYAYKKEEKRFSLFPKTPL
jgi:hypothetical protein